MIRNWTYLDEYEELKSEILAAVQEVFASGRLILGDRGAAFERRFAAYCGNRFGVGVNSGTDAIFLALRALGIGPGDEVITVPNTAVPTVSAIRATGATPVFVDVTPTTYLMDVAAVEARVTARTRAIMPVHLYGQCVEMEPLVKIARARGVAILEDCAQSHGATSGGRMSGGFGEIAAFSFYPTKVLGAYGDGGMCLTDRKELAERLRQLRMYGMEGSYYSYIEGFNSRLDEVQAAILDVKLKHLDRFIARRRQIARMYDEGLKGLVTTPAVGPTSTHVYYLYVIRHASRDRLVAELAARDIEVGIHFPVPIHLMAAYRFLGHGVGDFPRAEAAASEICSLPMYPGLPDASVVQVIETIRTVLGQG
jgi:aminotransferase EvaB